MDGDAIKLLIQSLERHDDFSSIKGTWVLLIPHYQKSLSDALANEAADAIIKAIQQDYQWISWPDCKAAPQHKKLYIPSYEDRDCIGFLRISNPKPDHEWHIRPMSHPLLQMNSMFRNLIISTKLYVLFQNMKLCLVNINDPIKIQNEKNEIELLIQMTNYSHSEIRDELWNIFLASISNTALAFDESLCLLYPHVEQYIDLQSPLLDGKFIINQLRNAFAHGVREPYWIIHKKHRDKYKGRKIDFYLSEDGDLSNSSSVNAKHIVFDPQTTNHKPFELGDIGGSGAYICLLKFLFKESRLLIDKYNLN